MRIDGKVNIGCGSTMRFADGSFFPKPGSACMLVSADVTSISEYPLLINFASYLKKKSDHNPFATHRLKRL